MNTSIELAGQYMRETGVAGWLTQDYRYTNPIFWQLFGPRVANLTRPVWLWVPAGGEPVLLCHEVDAGRFGPSAPDIRRYRSRADMVEALRLLLGKKSGASPVIAMDYSEMFELPRVSRADAGSVELIRSLGVKIVSSGDVLQFATERWSPPQLESHRFAAKALTRAVKDAFNFIGENVRWKLTEHDVAEFIRGRFDRLGLEYDDGPVVAFNENSSDPHYEPTPGGAAVVRRDGWLLIDLWGRQKAPLESGEPAISGDITWVAKIGDAPSQQQQRVFDAVRSARDAAFEFLESEVLEGRYPQGWEVDRVARQIIGAAGYGDYFVHRLGHSLGHEVHSNGVNLDDWESHDTRAVIDGVGVTIEPGIYLPDFGVRLEMDVYMGEDGPEITVERQDEIFPINP